MNNPTTPPSYVDQALSFEMVKNLCSGKGNAWSELGKFILIIGMDQFKLLFKAIVDKLITDIKEFKLTTICNPLEWIKQLYLVIQGIYTKVKSLLVCKKEKEEVILHITKDEVDHSPINMLQLHINLQLSFWEYVASESFQSNVSYITTSIENMVQKDNNTLQFEEEWNNIVINITDEVYMIIKNPIILTFEYKYSKRSIAKLTYENPSISFKQEVITQSVLQTIYQTSMNHTPDNHKFTTIHVSSFITDKILVLKLKEMYKNHKTDIDNLIITEWHRKGIFLYIFCNTVQPYGKFMFETIHSVDTFIFLFCLHTLILYNKRKPDFKTKCVDSVNLKIRNCECMLLGYPTSELTTSLLSNLKAKHDIHLLDPMHQLFSALTNKYIYTYFITENTSGVTDAYKRFVNNICYISNLIPYYDESESKGNLKIANSVFVQLYSNNPTVDLRDKCLSFLSNTSKQIQLISANSTIGNSIKTYDIRMEYKETISQLPNQEYEKYKKRLEELKSLPKSDVTEKLIAECVSNIPDEHTTVTQFTKEVVCTSINEVYKSLDRLYLSKRDKHKLTSMLQDFRDDKETLKSLGLPNKLCVLLYGLPGTGKSSSIETICTFLQKDMYNLNLKSVRSNEDLAALWDHVTNKTKNGGCIVIEDIDCQTNVVLARNEHTRNEEFTQSQPLTPNETPLSLSYLLNILQGSLQRDNSVVIVTTNWIQKLDPAFTRSMRFDVKIDMKPADHEQIMEIYSVYFPKKNVPVDLIKRVEEHKFTPAQFIDEFRQHIKNQDMSDEELFTPFLK